jgi:tetratricopeptide (TPR) repeat protein
MKCASCGHVNTRDARFCEECGAPLGVAEAPALSSWWVIPTIVLFIAAAFAAVLLITAKRNEREEEQSGVTPGKQTTPKHQAQRPTLVSSDQALATVEGFAPLIVKLKPVSFERSLNEGALSYMWEFAPGRREFSKETGGRAIFTYSDPGVYSAKLTISDESGDIARQVWEVVVLPEQARDVLLAYQSQPRDAAANVGMALVYMSVGAEHSGAYYAMRAFLANPHDAGAIRTLAGALERFPRFDEYLHYVLLAGTREPSTQDEFKAKLDEKMALWQEALTYRRAELNSTVGRPSRAVVSNFLSALVALRDYPAALKFVNDAQLIEEQLDNLAWYALNTGKTKEAANYAARWLSTRPDDPYGLEYMMLTSALDNRYDDARKYLKSYLETSPQRGHAISVFMDVIIFTDNGLTSAFAWEVADKLRVFM